MATTVRPFDFRQPTRLSGYDYRQPGAYFVTLCTYGRRNLFGRISSDEMVLSSLGKLVEMEWKRIALSRKHVELDLFVVMPNHLHGVVVIEGSAMNTSHVAAAEGRTGAMQAGSLGAIISQFKAGVTRRARYSPVFRDAKIWQRNYYDRIVRSEESLNQIRQYIMANPARWREDSLYVE